MGWLDTLAVGSVGITAILTVVERPMFWSNVRYWPKVEAICASVRGFHSFIDEASSINEDYISVYNIVDPNYVIYGAVEGITGKHVRWIYDDSIWDWSLAVTCVVVSGSKSDHSPSLQRGGGSVVKASLPETLTSMAGSLPVLL
jgi:hypothetical protein